jgi:hypothetical protein
LGGGSRAAQEPWGTAAALAVRAELAARQGDRTGVWQAAGEALELYEQLRYPPGIDRARGLLRRGRDE